MKISDTYKRYLEVRDEIESFSGRLTFSVADNRSPDEKIAELNKLYAEYYALEAELRAYLKPFADMARELGKNYISLTPTGNLYEIRIGAVDGSRFYF